MQNKADEGPDEWTWQNNFVDDAITAMKIGVPIMISSSSKLLQSLIFSVLLGRKDTVLLAAYSVSTIWTEIIDEATRGGTGQIGVLCGQALGSRNYKLVGTWLQMGLLMVSTLYVPMALAKAATGPMLSLLGVPAILAEPAGRLAIYLAPAMIFELLYAIVTNYFYAQGIVGPDAAIQIIAIPCASVLMWVFVYPLDMGLYGVALAWSIKRFVKLVALCVISFKQGYYKKTWKGWDWNEVLVGQRWSLLLSLCIPAACGSIAEILLFAINSIFAARLGPTASAAFDLIISVFLVLYTNIWGMTQGFTLIMAKRLGQGRPVQAQGIVKAGTVVCYGVVLGVAAFIYFFMKEFAEFSSYDPKVRVEMINVRLLGTIGILSSGGMYLVAEVLAKQGRVVVVFLTLTLFNWGVGLPICFFLTPIYGIAGIFMGTNISYFLSFLVCTYFMLQSDWELLSQQARKNAEAEHAASQASMASSGKGKDS